MVFETDEKSQTLVIFLFFKNMPSVGKFWYFLW